MISTPLQQHNSTGTTAPVFGLARCACPRLGMCCCMPSASAPTPLLTVSISSVRLTLAAQRRAGTE